jgi:hypothetical protein
MPAGWEALLGRTFTPGQQPSHVLVGYSCEGCGFVELYKVALEELARTLAMRTTDKAHRTPPGDA